MTSLIFPKQIDQIYPTYSKIKRQIDQMECIPSWEEILEYEYVRQSGKFNMFERDNIQRYAYDSGLYHLVNWIQRCKEFKRSYIELYGPAMKHYSELYGRREKWISGDMKKKLQLKELQSQQSDLQRKLQEIESKLSQF